MFQKKKKEKKVSLHVCFTIFTRDLIDTLLYNNVRTGLEISSVSLFRFTRAFQNYIMYTTRPRVRAFVIRVLSSLADHDII